MVEAGLTYDSEIFADRAEPKSIFDLRKKGWNIKPAPKFTGSIMQGIELLKKWKVNILDTSRNIIKEKNNYKWKVHAQGNNINKPIDNYNHHMDGIRGVVLFQSIKNNL